MSGADRRALLRLVAGALVLPLAAAIPARAASAARFAPPAGLMRYTRRLERELGRGGRLVVSRSFAVRFRPEPAGFRVEGEQVDVAVEAPENLAEFVRLERERQELGLFPLLLDPAGGIAGGPNAPLSTQLDAVVREALAQLSTQTRDPEERAELARFLNALHQSAGRIATALPDDLFAPGPTPRSEHREIALPGGDAGEVTVTFAAERDPATGLMRAARREVVTSLEGERRHTLESWTLTPFI